VTEYSLKPLWDAHREDDLAPSFLARAAADPADQILPPPAGVTKVWQYIDDATRRKRSQAEWDAWNAHTPWLEENRQYLCRSFAAFRKDPRFWLGFYALRQGSGAGGFGATDGAWILNSLLTTATVAPAPGALPTRYAFFDDFVALREGRSTSCDREP
jgi:hypothetical protein